MTGTPALAVRADRPAAGVRGVLPAAAARPARLQHQGARHRRADGSRRGGTSSRTRPCREAIITSLMLAVLTVVGMVVLLVPTMIWVRLRVPRRDPAGGVPVPAAADDPRPGDRGRAQERLRLGELPGRRLGADAGLRVRRAGAAVLLPRDRLGPLSIDARTLAEAARSLGASWVTVIVRVITPNILPASSARPSSRWRSSSASTPSPRSCTTTRCRW